MSRPPIRLGLIGCGRLAELGYVPAIARVASVELVAVADPDPTRRASVAELASTSATAARVAAFADARTMAEGIALDAAVVASPVAAHLDDARTLTGAGVAVLVEKPPAPDVVGADALAAITPRPWVGFNRRFDAGARRVRDAVARDGRLDLRLEIHYRRASWRAHAVHDDALLDLGPHLVDWASWLMGCGIVAVEDAELGRDRAVCTLTSERGRAWLVARCDQPHRELVEARDGSGALVARAKTGGPVTAVRARVARAPHPLVSSLAAQLTTFADAVRGGPTGDLATAIDAAAVMRVLDAARASAAAAGQPVAVTSRLDA